MARSILLIAALVIFWPAVLHAQPFSPREQSQVDQLVTTALSKSGVPSASVAVVRGGEIAFVKAYGSARLAPARAATTDARYDIGSVAKQFTATLVLMLADEGRLSLDDKVGRFLPGVSGGDQVTLRQLLSQTSGYVNYWRVDYLPPSMRRDVRPQAIVDHWAHAPLEFPPGTRWAYSNTNYTMAGRIVEQIERRPLAASLQARIFTPLGMNSALAKGQPPFTASDALGYTRAALGPPRRAAKVPPGWLFSAGGLSMTASDLARWDVAMLDRRLLSPSGYQAQQTEAHLTDGSGAGYGLGVYVQQVNGHRVVSHDGADMGYLTQNRVYPDDGAAVVVMVNADYGSAQFEIAEGLEQMLLGAKPTPPIQAAAPIQAASPTPGDAATTTLAHRVLDDLAAGRLDQSLFTKDGASYFTAQVRADLRTSLARLGPAPQFELKRRDRFAGYDASIHELHWQDHKLVLIMFRTDDGRIEEYNLFSPD